MPFRTNFFREQIAQPETTWPEIDNVLCDAGTAAATPYGADIYKDADDEFKVGGVLRFSGESFDDPEKPSEGEMNFDGFETIDGARNWLIEIGVPAREITEV